MLFSKSGGKGKCHVRSVTRDLVGWEELVETGFGRCLDTLLMSNRCVEEGQRVANRSVWDFQVSDRH